MSNPWNAFWCSTSFLQSCTGQALENQIRHLEEHVISAATITAVQPALFDLNFTYTEADRVADCQLCSTHLNQWASSFKSESAATVISTADFKAADARLAQ